MWSTSLAAAAAATVLLALPLTVSASPSSLPSSDCASDGFFGLGCSSDFLACSGGRALTMSCPAELVYDETRQLCEYPGNVVACGGEAPEEGSGIEEGSGTEGSGVDGSGEGSGVDEGSGEGSGEEIEDVTGMCSERADGFYRLAACGESFLGCSGGVAWRMECPASLKYDEEKQICDYPGNVEGCEEAGSGEEEGSGEVEGSGTEGSGTEEGSVINGSGTEPASDDLTIEKMEEEQINTEDVVVTEDKSVIEEKEQVKQTEDDIIDDNSVLVEEKEAKEEEYVKKMEAEDDIIDDSAVVEEEKKEDVREIEAEGDIINNTVVEEEKEVKVEEEEVTETNEGSPAQSDEENATPSCEGRADGFYAMGCSSEMLACSNGHAHVMMCPAGLVFDELNQICDHSVHVAACSSRDQLLTDDSLLTTDDDKPHPEIPRTRDSELVAATLAPTTPAGPIAAAAAAAAAAASEYAPRRETAALGARKSRRDSRCKSSDGVFALDCSVEFVSCRAGVATKLECREGETFDESAQSCVSLSSHPTCFTHARQTADVIDEDVQMEKEQDDQTDLLKPIDHSFDCDFVGARAEEECADWFRLCESGRGIEMYCLQGHLFDGVAAKCVPAGQLEHCKAH